MTDDAVDRGAHRIERPLIPLQGRGVAGAGGRRASGQHPAHHEQREGEQQPARRPFHATAASGWSLSGSILTFAMPMLLFIAAATVLYLLFTRPHQVPGDADAQEAGPGVAG
ncbi:MAG TPA: hypothetical protein VGI74_13675 [Streptosporangiaceae bacterium]